MKGVSLRNLDWMQESKDVFPGGATRNHLPYRYDLIRPEILQDLALALAEGAESHGARNWEQSINQLEFLDAVMNHLWNHLVLYQMGDRSEPHLGKVVFGCMVLRHAEAVNAETAR